MMRAVGQGESSQRGFTLIEMLVSLVLLALILTVLAQMIFGARAALGFIDRRAAQSPVTAAQTYLRAAISQANNLPAESRAGQTVFAGSPAEMTFVSAHAPRGAYQGLYKVTLRVAHNSAKANDLVADLQLARPATGATQPPVTTVPLVRNIQSVSFGYIADGETGAVSSWDAAVLPHIVTISVHFPAGDRRSWNAMSIAPELSNASAISCPSRTKCD